MSTALYRKYRPKSFDGVIGQDHIISTLKNQIKNGRVGHAYLFCGSRGVGKTSLARIFARAINCADLKNAPCGTCESCKKNQNENNLDIIEIDAASNNGVDDARDLREKVKYPPISGKYKVYIIDEVHMLTGSAFNALLKTLEEPPSHAVFILATTEPHKLPATILSRCQRFDFRLVSMHELFVLLANIYNLEGRKYQDEALRAIAAYAEGSARDALSLADTCLNLPCEVLTAEAVGMAVGGDTELSEQLFGAIASGDIRAALGFIDRLYESGKSMNVVAKEIAIYARDLMLAKTAPNILKSTNERTEKLKKEAENHSLSSLATAVQMFSEMDSSLRYSINPRITMEAAAVRAVKLYALDLNALDERLLRIENRLDNMGAPENLARKDSHKEQETEKEVAVLKSLIKQANESKAKKEAQFLAEINADIKAEIQGQKPTENMDISPADSAQAGQAKPTIGLNPQQLWGRVITYFRRNSTPALTQAVGRQNPARLKLKSDLLVIFARREDYLLMCEEGVLDTLRAAISAEGYDIKIAVEKDSEDIDMEKAVQKLYDEFGKNKVNIIK